MSSGAILMCRMHECRGCMDAQERPFRTFSFVRTKKRYTPLKGGTKAYDKREILRINKVRLSGGMFLLDSRIRENDEL